MQKHGCLTPNTQRKHYLLYHILVTAFIMTTCLMACKRPADFYAIPTEPPSSISKTYTPTLPNLLPKQEPTYTTILEEFSILNTAGNTIYGIIRRPDPELYPTLSFAAVVKIPGGINPGRNEVLTPEVIALAEAGMVVVCFNAEGRVDNKDPSDMASGGSEDYNGFRNQDTLAEIIKHTAQLPYVMKDNIGLRTQSYGITMAAGCVTRYTDLPVKYIVDGEGPPSSYVTVHEPWALFSSPDHPFHNKYETVHEILGHYSTYRDSSPENLEFWSQREAIDFIGDFNGMYLRLQAEWDHAQPPNQPSEVKQFHQPPTWWQGKHTCDIVNAAVEGGVPWVLVNPMKFGNRINAIYSADDLPVYIPGELKREPMIAAAAVLEMVHLEPAHR